MRIDPLRSRPALLRYGVPVLAVGLMTFIKWVLPASIGRDTPFLLALAPALVAAWYGGHGPGVLGALLGTASVSYFFLEPYESFRATPAAAAHTAVFALESLLVAWLMASIQGARHRTEVAARRVEGIYTISSALGNAHDPRDVAEIVLHEAVSVIGATGVAIYLRGEADGPLRLVAHLGRPPLFAHLAELAPFREVPVAGDSPVGLAAKTCATVATEDEHELRERFPRLDEAAGGNAVPPAIICAPMNCHNDILGVLVINFPKPRPIRPEDRSWVQTVAQDCGMALERTRLFAAERRARLEAEQASRTKDQFLAIVSNELRAPLTSIVGWAHTLKSRVSDGQRYRHGLDIIEQSAQAQARLVNDILDMSRIVAGRLEVEMKGLELGAIVASVVEELRVLAAAKGLSLDFAAHGQALVVGDQRRLRQVFDILLNNAFKFTPPGGQVRVEMDVANRRAFVRVMDTGRGIAEKDMAGMFERFRGEPSAERPEGGLGLGLGIAKYIVQAHRGALRIDSAGPGRGTTVTLELPLAEPAAGALAVGKETGSGQPARLEGLRVFVVDDDTDAREVLAEILSSEGADVKTSVSARAALAEVDKFSPDVVVSDVRMPGEDALWFIRELRSSTGPAAHAPALALTAQSQPEYLRAILDAGYQKCVPKPPDPRALTAAVAQLGGSNRPAA